MGIEENVEATKLVQELYEFVTDQVPERLRLLVLERIARLAAADVGKILVDQKTGESQTMTDTEAKRFGKTLMPGGKYAGQLIEDVDFEYICMLVDPTRFMGDLKRYARWKSDQTSRAG